MEQDMLEKMILDKYEQKIENEIGNYQSLSASEKAELNNIIDKENTKQSISLRIRKYDLEKLKERAEQEGIPYQTLLLSVIHKYVTDQLIDKRNLLKSMQLLKTGKMG